MKSQHHIRRINLSNLETKRNVEERIKKKMKENKDKINNKEKKTKINYEKKNYKIDKTLLSNIKLNNTNINNNRYINNSGYIKKDKSKKELNKTLNNNEKNFNKNIFRTNENNYNKYVNKTIEFDEIKESKRNNNINSENNCQYAINNNILYLINSNYDNNIIENLGLDNLAEKRHLRKNNSSSKIYSSPNKEINNLNYRNIRNNNFNINTKGIFNSKNYLENRNGRNTNIIKENNTNFTNFIYKKTTRNNSCFKRGKYYKNFDFEFKDTKKENEFDTYINSPSSNYIQRKDRNISSYILPIKEDFNRDVNNNKKCYIYEVSINDNNNQKKNINKTFINKKNDMNSIDYYNIAQNRNNNVTKIYNKIRTKRMIKTSIRKRSLTNSFAHNDNNINNNIDMNESNKNNKTIVINRRSDFNKYKVYKNQCNIYLNNNINEEQNNNFSKTSAFLFKNNKKINENLKEKPKNIKDSTISKKETYFYNDYKTLENFFNDKNKIKDVNIKKENTIDSSPIIFHKNAPIYLNKASNRRKSNNKIYYKKNINDKKTELSSYIKAKTFKKVKTIYSTITNDINISNEKINDENNNNKSSIENIEIDDSIIENMNETVNNNHCFQKKIYNYYIKKPKIKQYCIDKVTYQKSKKEKLINHNSSNKKKNISDSEWKYLQNVSDIENKTLSIKNISKEYTNFELSEIDDKKNSIENEKIIIEMKEDKINELSNYQKISLGAKKLNEIFIKKNEPEKRVRRTMTEEKFYLGNSKLNDIININQKKDLDLSNNTIQVNKKILTYKPKKNILLEDEENNEKVEKEKECEKKYELNKILNYKNNNLANNENLLNSEIIAHINCIKNPEIIKDEKENIDNENKVLLNKKNNDTNSNIKLNNSNNNFYSKITEEIKNENTIKIDKIELDEKDKMKSKKKSRSTEKRNLKKLIEKNQTEIKQNNKENKKEEINKEIILKDFENYLKYLEKEKINNKEDIYDGMSDSYNWKVIDELITEKNIRVEDIIKIYIDICKNNNFINKNNIFKANEYIKSIIEYYTNNLSKNQKEIIHLNMIETINDIDNILNNSNKNIYELLGNLLFILLKAKLYYMKDLNIFIEKEKSTQINIAKIVKYAILASGNLSKQYHNDFKFTKLFNNNDIFINYVTKEIFGDK